MKICIRVASAAIASACLVPAGALAQDPQRETVSVRVLHADLDLSREAGRATLQRRVRHAIAAACAPETHDLAMLADSARCQREMTADATIRIAAAQERSGMRLASVSSGR